MIKKYLKKLFSISNTITDNSDVIAITHKAAEEKSQDIQNKIQKLWDLKVNQTK